MEMEMPWSELASQLGQLKPPWQYLLPNFQCERERKREREEKEGNTKVAVTGVILILRSRDYSNISRSCIWYVHQV